MIDTCTKCRKIKLKNDQIDKKETHTIYLSLIRSLTLVVQSLPPISIKRTWNLLFWNWFHKNRLTKKKERTFCRFLFFLKFYFLNNKKICWLICYHHFWVMCVGVCFVQLCWRVQNLLSLNVFYFLFFYFFCYFSFQALE